MRAKFQRVVSRSGAVSYRKQVVDPVTKQRMHLTGATPEEVMGRAHEIETLRKRLAAGLASTEEVARAAARVGAPEASMMVRDTWAAYLATLEPAWRAKVEGLGKLHVLPPGKLGALSVYQLDFERMESWAAGLSGADKSRQNIWFCVRSMVARLIRAGKLAGFPWGDFKVRAPRRARGVGATRGAVTNPDDLARLIRAARELDARAVARGGAELPDLANRVLLLHLTSMRRGEAAALAWDCLRTLEDGALRLHIAFQAREGWRRDVRRRETLDFARPKAPPKADSERDVIFRAGDPAIAAFAAQRALLEARGLYRPNGPVFPDARGHFRARDVVRPEVMRACARLARLPHAEQFVQHSSRHGTATLMLGAGAHPRDVMEITGHRRMETLSVYMHAAGRGVRAPMLATHEALGLDASPAAPRLDAPRLLEDAGPVVIRGGVVSSAEVLAAPPRASEERMRLYHARSLGRDVADFDLAWRQWRALGEPPAPPKAARGQTMGRAHLPPEAVAAAERSAKRRQEEERRRGKLTGETDADFAARRSKAYRRAFASSVNGWHTWRLRRCKLWLALAVEGRAEGPALMPSTLAELRARGASVPASMLAIEGGKQKPAEIPPASTRAPRLAAGTVRRAS